MASVVFLRGVNVGGARRFLPSALAKELSSLEVVNLGAAGTFVVRSGASPSRIREEIARRLPFTTDIVVCPAAEVVRLAATDPFGPLPNGAKATVTVLVRAGAAAPRLPFHVPETNDWEVKVVGVRGRYVLGIYRRQGGHMAYPNPIVEREFGVGATTRGWATFLSIARILGPD